MPGRHALVQADIHGADQHAADIACVAVHLAALGCRRLFVREVGQVLLCDAAEGVAFIWSVYTFHANDVLALVGVQEGPSVSPSATPAM